MCCGRLQLNPCIARGRESISMVKVRLQIAGGRRGKIGMRIAALLNIAPCGQSVRSDPVFFAFFSFLDAFCGSRRDITSLLCSPKCAAGLF